FFFFFFSSRRRHTRFSRDWSSDVCSSDLTPELWDRTKRLDGRWIDRGHEIDVWLNALGGLVESYVIIDDDSDMTDAQMPHFVQRSEERRVGKECRSRWWREEERRKSVRDR